MATDSRNPVDEVLWHLCTAVDLINRARRRERDTPPPAAENAPSPTVEELLERLKDSGTTPPERKTQLPSVQTALQPAIEQIGAGNFLTLDRVEIHGRLGSDDARELRINGNKPIPLERRDHALLLILAWRSKLAAAATNTASTSDPAFMPVNAILTVLDQLVAKGNFPARRWVCPSDVDIWRCVSDLRRLLAKRGFNRNLIETGQRGSGYRLSTPASHILIAAAHPQEKVWTALLGSAVGGQGGSIEANPSRS